MSKILCVLYPDPVDGYPTAYARDNLPKIDHYPAAKLYRRQKQSTSHPALCSEACRANLACANFLKIRGTLWL